MRLIDADALMERLGMANECDGCPNRKDALYCKLTSELVTVCEEIADAPTVDPVKRGKWVNDNGLYKCTACNDHCAVAGWADCIPEEHMYRAFKFCPNCGAKMQRSEDE